MRIQCDGKVPPAVLLAELKLRKRGGLLRRVEGLYNGGDVVNKRVNCERVAVTQDQNGFFAQSEDLLREWLLLPRKRRVWAVDALVPGKGGGVG